MYRIPVKCFRPITEFIAKKNFAFVFGEVWDTIVSSAEVVSGLTEALGSGAKVAGTLATLAADFTKGSADLLRTGVEKGKSFLSNSSEKFINWIDDKGPPKNLDEYKEIDKCGLFPIKPSINDRHLKGAFELHRKLAFLVYRAEQLGKFIEPAITYLQLAEEKIDDVERRSRGDEGKRYRELKGLIDVKDEKLRNDHDLTADSRRRLDLERNLLVIERDQLEPLLSTKMKVGLPQKLLVAFPPHAQGNLTDEELNFDTTQMVELDAWMLRRLLTFYIDQHQRKLNTYYLEAYKLGRLKEQLLKAHEEKASKAKGVTNKVKHWFVDTEYEDYVEDVEKLNQRLDDLRAHKWASRPPLGSPTPLPGVKEALELSKPVQPQAPIQKTWDTSRLPN